MDLGEEPFQDYLQFFDVMSKISLFLYLLSFSMTVSLHSFISCPSCPKMTSGESWSSIYICLC